LIGNEADYYPSPKGQWIHKSCWHHWEAGWSVNRNGDTVDSNNNVVEHVQRCKYQSLHRTAAGTFSADGANDSGAAPVLNGNIEWVQASLANGSTMVDAAWETTVVPSNPAVTNEELFIWMGFGNTANSNLVLQPVLQFATNLGPPACAFFESPSDWAVLNYYIDPNNNGYCGGITFVNPGDTIDMIVEVDDSQPCSNSGTNCSWVAAYEVNKSTNWSSGEVFGEPLVMNKAILGSLELGVGGGTISRGELPPPQAGLGTIFYVDGLWMGYPNWNSFAPSNSSNTSFSGCWGQSGCPPIPSTVPSNCGWGTHITSPSDVVLNYHN
jgi:hypothetical protein